MKKNIALITIALVLIWTPLISNDLGLTKKEQLWLKNHNTIIISGPRAFPPFQFFTKDAVVEGIAKDYAHLISKRIGIKFIYQKELLWPDVLKKAKDKNIDVISCISKTKKRQKYLNYSIPFLSFPMVIINRKNSTFISGLKDLQGAKVVFIKKISTYEWIKKDKITTIPYFVNSPLEALKAVSNGRGNAYIGNLGTITYLIEKHGLTNLKIAAPTHYGNYTLHFAVRKDWSQMIPILNKAITSIKPHNHAAIRNKWLTIKYDFGLRIYDILIWVFVSIIISAIIIGFILHLNSKLKKEIKMRVQVSNDLQIAVENIEKLEGLLPICASCKNIRDTKDHWSKVDEYIEKHSNVSLTHSICPDCVEKLYGKEKWFQKEDYKK